MICDCWLYFKIRSQRLRARYEGEAFNFSFNIRLKVFMIVITMVNKREWVNLRFLIKGYEGMRKRGHLATKGIIIRLLVKLLSDLVLQ